MVANTSTVVASGWKKLSDGLGWAGRKLETVAKEQGLMGPGGQAHHEAPGGRYQVGIV